MEDRKYRLPIEPGSEHIATLRIGESLPLYAEMLGRQVAIMYAGMPGEDTFSVVVQQKALLSNSTYHLHFPKGSTDLKQILENEDVEGELEVLELAPNLIRLRHFLPK